MTSCDPPPPTPNPWDRVGSFFGDMASVTATIANRNMELWRTPPFGTDGGYATAGMPVDWSRWTEVAMRNTQDICALWLGLPPRGRVAYPVATVFLEIKWSVDEDGDTCWIAFDAVWIPVGWAAVFVDHPTRLSLAALRIVAGGEPMAKDPQHGDPGLPGWRQAT